MLAQGLATLSPRGETWTVFLALVTDYLRCLEVNQRMEALAFTPLAFKYIKIEKQIIL